MLTLVEAVLHTRSLSAMWCFGIRRWPSRFSPARAAGLTLLARMPELTSIGLAWSGVRRRWGRWLRIAESRTTGPTRVDRA
ncbi:MAG TPA: hypothetical protein VIS06_05495, partial [Mycobacteriales bacterium]